MKLITIYLMIHGCDHFCFYFKHWSSGPEQARHLLVRQPIRMASDHIHPNQVNRRTSSEHFNDTFARSLFGLLYNSFFFLPDVYLCNCIKGNSRFILSALCIFVFLEGRKKEIWQGNREILCASGKTPKFVFKKERVLFTRGNIWSHFNKDLLIYSPCLIWSVYSHRPVSFSGRYSDQ